MTKREKIYQKYNGLCAYSGTPLENDWQMEHIQPKQYGHFCASKVMRELYNIKVLSVNHLDNLVPVQRIINHYKRGLTLSEYRDRLNGLHNRLKKLPVNPSTDRGKRRKEYLLKVSSYFGITPDKPFSGFFYFETVSDKHTELDGGIRR